MTLVVVSLAVLVALAGCSLPSTFAAHDRGGSTPEPMTVRITAVEDGDTYWFENESGQEVGIRLVGVDTPEIKGRNYPTEYPGVPDNESGKRWLYRWGLSVRNETRDRLVGETVRLEFDSRLPKRDYYGRLVAYVYHDGELVNRQLLERGQARVYPVSFGKRDAFERAASEARSADRGVWNYTVDTSP